MYKEYTDLQGLCITVTDVEFIGFAASTVFGEEEISKLLKKHFNRKSIDQAIQDSKYILDLKDDHYGDGGCRYKKETWERAVSFILNNYSLWGYNIHSLTIDPGPYGSIDIYWKNKLFECLVNFPECDTEPAEYYIDNYRDIYDEGKIIQTCDDFNPFDRYMSDNHDV